MKYHNTICYNCGPFITQDAITDSYNHTLPPQHRVIKGHYLEFFHEQKDCYIYTT